MHINYSLIKQCYDTVLQFKTVFSASRCLSTTNFRTWSIPCCTMSKTTCHLPCEMYLADTSLSCRSQWCLLTFEEAFGVLITNWSMIFCSDEGLMLEMSVFKFFWLIYIFNLVDKTKLSMIMFVSRYCKRNYILQAMIKLFLRWYLHWKHWVEYTNNCEWSINTEDCLFLANEQSLSIEN